MYSWHHLSAQPEHELTVSSSDNTRENATISHFSKVVKNLSRAASPQGPHWCMLKDCDSSVCIWYGVFLAATRESQLWENCKRERQDELMGLQKSCQKPFLSMLCPTDIHLASWKVKTAKTSGLKRTFQLLRDTSQQGWAFEKKRRKKSPWNSGNGGTSRRRGMLKNQIPRSENGAEMNVAVSSENRGERKQTRTGCVDSGVPTAWKSIWRIPINIFLIFVYGCSVCLWQI